MNISLLRKIDYYVGVPILNLERFKTKRQLPKNPKKILLIKLFGLGNFVFLGPTIAEIKKTYPDATIEVLTLEQNKDITSMYPLIDETHLIGFQIFRMMKDISRFIRMNKGKYDIVFDCEQFVRLSALIALSVRAKYLIGIPTERSGKLMAYDAMIICREKQHAVDEYYRLMSLLPGKHNKTVELVKPKFSASAKCISIYNRFKSKTLIGICAGSRSDGAEKRYPKERLLELMKLILNDTDAILIFIGAPGEKDYVDNIIDGNKSCYNACGLSLQDSTFLISKLKVFISNDTGPIHIAAALSIPCVGIYGPTDEKVYGPYSKNSVVLRGKHKPLWNNQNEKNCAWNPEWWPEPMDVYKAYRKIGK